MNEHEQQQPAPRRGKVLEALTRAERKFFTRPAPKSAKAQVKFLLTRAKGSTKALVERLGVSRRSVERYRSGKLTTHRSASRPPWWRRQNPSGNCRSGHRRGSRLPPPAG